MKTARLKIPLYWGLLHGVNDWIAGYMLAHFTLTTGSKDAMLSLIVYSILAFGGQLPVGIWLDAKKDLKSFGLISALLLLICCPVYFISPFLAVLIAGFASAGVHVCGGCICLMLNKEKFTPLGIFTAPGVAGLTLGGFCGYMNSYLLLVAFVMALILFFLLVKNGFPAYSIAKKVNNELLDSHDIIMIILLLIMSLRSFLFDLVNTFSGQFGYGLLVIGLSAFAGKIIGSMLADKIGWKKWVFISLSLAFIFLELGHDNLGSLAFGVACLQSSVPITLQLMYNSIPYYPATASAMSLGTIVALAGLPLYATPWLHTMFNTSSVMFMLLIVILASILFAGFLFYKRHQEKTKALI